MTAFSSPPSLPGTHDPDRAALVLRLAAPDASVRRIALLELADLEESGLVPSFVAALNDDPSADVRSEAARVLGAWEQPDVVDALCGALLDQDDDVRAAAARSLSELKGTASGAVLRRWADRPESFVRRAVLRGLRELRDPDAFAPALRALDAEHADVRAEAVAVLGWLRDPRALPSLACIATTDAAADVRRAAVGAIGFAAPDDAATTDALLAALRDREWQVREEAATTLGKLRVAAARDPLAAALDDDYWQVRLRAARALGQLRDAAAAPAVAALLSHAISNLRKEAALALGELRDRATLPALTHALEDHDPEVRKAVRIAIRQIDEASR
ncbi:HEAT repeat domain-containing protein [Burkholderia cepacia]|uniref:HEAT repeat domain-containing protein n=1 Tax=Burkholderia cepacia TaxID=292 RepID=UPI00075E99CB|nr:HEAT repeat domain-containing protein [Burkholderia cepacia]KVL06564.1 PBS lyase [Burkholderia cepacia]